MPGEWVQAATGLMFLIKPACTPVCLPACLFDACLPACLITPACMRAHPCMMHAAPGAFSSRLSSRTTSWSARACPTTA